jgi:hypothetical protein
LLTVVDLTEPIREEDLEPQDEFDFLTNFEKLSMKYLADSDYGKAQIYLRKAVDISKSKNRDPDQLKALELCLAATYSMMDEWETAEAILLPHRRPKTIEDLAAMRLFQGVAIAFARLDKLEDAFRLCRIAVQGHKAFIGEAKEGYEQSMATLAFLYECDGHSAEAEAIRHSLSTEHEGIDTEGSKKYAQQYIDDYVIQDWAPLSTPLFTK